MGALVIVTADIMRLVVDVIVNAANQSFLRRRRR